MPSPLHSSARWFWNARDPIARLSRILVLAALGWTALQWCCLPSHAGQPLQEEWPRTDFSQRTVELGSILSGGPPKDGIPAIDRPRFVDIDQARDWLAAREPVVVVELADRARAYPIQILMFHEIVNDRLGGIPIAVTFCPLCNSALTFDRRHDGRVLDFGTTGKSDLIMYDRQSESWWQQFTGRGIVGEYAGAELQQIPSQILAFERFAELYPRAEVLSRDTGYRRNYGSNPYVGYDDIDQSPFLMRGGTDPRLRPMERVLAVELDGDWRLYPFSRFEGQPVIEETWQDKPVVIFSRRDQYSALDRASIAGSRLTHSSAAFRPEVDGRRLSFEAADNGFRDRETGSLWALNGEALEGPLAGERLPRYQQGIHFAFAWLAFRPDSSIYGRND